LAKCPECNTNQKVIDLVLLFAINKSIKCNECATSLKINYWKMKTFYISLYSLGIFSGAIIFSYKGIEGFIPLLLVIAIGTIIFPYIAKLTKK